MEQRASSPVEEQPKMGSAWLDCDLRADH